MEVKPQEGGYGDFVTAFPSALPCVQSARAPDDFRKGFARLQPLELSFEAWLFYPQLPDLADLLCAYPDANVVLNHVGGLLGLAPHDGNREAVFTNWRVHIRELLSTRDIRRAWGRASLDAWRAPALRLSRRHRARRV